MIGSGTLLQTICDALFFFSHTPHNFRVCPPLKSPAKYFKIYQILIRKLTYYHFMLLFPIMSTWKKNFLGQCQRMIRNLNNYNYSDRILNHYEASLGLPYFYRTGTDFLSRILRLLFVTHKLNKYFVTSLENKNMSQIFPSYTLRP